MIILENMCCLFDDKCMFTFENTVGVIHSGFMISRNLLLCLKLICLSILRSGFRNSTVIVLCAYYDVAVCIQIVIRMWSVAKL